MTPALLLLTLLAPQANPAPPEASLPAAERAAFTTLRRGGATPVVALAADGRRHVTKARAPAQERMSRQEWEAVLALPWLEELNLNSRPLRLEDLESLKRLPRLRTLDVGGSDSINDRTVAALARLTVLVELHLNLTQVSGRGLQELAGLKALRKVSVLATKVSDEDVAVLTKFPRLEYVTLGGEGFTGAGVAYLADLPHLKSLGVKDGPLGRKFFASVARIKTLDTLSLQGCELRAVDAKHLASLPRLRQLHLIACTNLTDDTLRPLASCSLEALDLSGAPITAKEVRPLLRPSLRGLLLYQTAVTDDVVPDLSKLTDLKFLGVTGSRLSPAGVEKLKKALKRTTIVAELIGS